MIYLCADVCWLFSYRMRIYAFRFGLSYFTRTGSRALGSGRWPWPAGSEPWTVSNLKVAQQFHALLNTEAVSIRQAYYANVWPTAVRSTELDHNRIVVQFCRGIVITICKLCTKRIIWYTKLL